MFNIFKKKCPNCKMVLEEGKNYPEGYGKKFCSESCREEFGKKIAKEQTESSKESCH